MQSDPAFQIGYFAGAIISVLLIVGIIGFGLFAFIMALVRQTKGWIICAAIFILLGLGVLGVGVVAGVRGVLQARKTATQLKTKVSSDGWVSLQLPGHWKDMPQLGEVGTLKAGNAIREEYCVVISDTKADFAGTLEEFHEVVLGNMRQSTKDFRVDSPQPLTLNDFPARRVRFAGEVNAVRIVYHHTAVETPDGFHQLLMWTLPSKEAVAWPIFDRTAATFAVVNPPPAPPARKEVAPRTGTVTERFRVVVGEVLGKEPAQISLASTFAGDLGADSLDVVEIVMATEDEFGVEISDEAAERLKTPADFIKFLEAKAAAPVEPR